MHIFPKSVSIQRKEAVATAAQAVPAEVVVVFNHLNRTTPLDLSKVQVQRALEGTIREASIERFLDADVLQAAKKGKIPAIFFHLVITEFEDAAKLSKPNRKHYDDAKKLLNEMDGDIYASAESEVQAKASTKDLNEALIDAASRVLKKKGKDFESKSGIDRPIDFKALQRADKELRIRNRVESFLKAVKRMFPNCKFYAEGLDIVGRCDGELSIPKSSELTQLERDTGMVRKVNGNEIRWHMTPSQTFFASASESKTIYATVESSGKLGPLIDVIVKLDPKAHIYKDGEYLKVESKILKSPRLDDAFETVGKKCGATWMGRTDAGILVWQSKHDLEMTAAASKPKPSKKASAKDKLAKKLTPASKIAKPLKNMKPLSASDVTAGIAKIVARIAKIKPTAVLGKTKKQLGIDPLDEVEIVRAVEAKFKVKLKSGAFRSLGELAKLVCESKASGFKSHSSVGVSESAGKAKPRAKHDTVKQAAGVPRDVKPKLGVFYKIYVKPISYLIHLLQLKRKSSDEKDTINSLLKKLRSKEKKFMKENNIEVSLVDLLLKQRGLEAPKAA